jgi:hypothetical protein
MSTSSSSVTVVPGSRVVNEGQNLVILVQTQDISPGTILNYSMVGISSADYRLADLADVNVILSGQFAVKQDLFGAGIHGARLSLSLTTDYITEGSEFLEFKVESSSAGVIQIIDTSRADTDQQPPINWMVDLPSDSGTVYDLSMHPNGGSFALFSSQQYNSLSLNSTGGGSGNGGIVVQYIQENGHPMWYKAIDLLTDAKLAYSTASETNILSGRYYSGSNINKFLISSIDLTGNEQWSRLIDIQPWGHSLSVANDGSIYIAHVEWDGWYLRKLSSDGSTEWERALVVTDNSLDQRGNGWASKVSSAIGLDGRIWVSGNAKISSQDISGFLTSFTSDGTQGATRVVGVDGVDGVDDAIQALAVGPDGYVYVAGITYGAINGTAPYWGYQNRDVFLAKYSPNGNRNDVWTRVIGTNDNNSYDDVGDLAITRDGVIFLVGRTEIQDAIFAFDTNGEFVRSKSGLDGNPYLQGVRSWANAGVDANGALTVLGVIPPNPYEAQYPRLMKVSFGLQGPLDTNPPTISISSNLSSLVTGETAILTFTLSEPSTDFGVEDLAVSGGTISDFTGSGTSYTATFTPSTNSTTDGFISVASGKFSDAAGNQYIDGNEGTNWVSIGVNTVIPPTIAISSDKTTLATGETATITFTLSEASTDFTLEDISVAWGTLSKFKGSGTTYTATFTPTAEGIFDATIRVAENKFSNATGIFNVAGGDAASTLSISIKPILSGIEWTRLIGTNTDETQVSALTIGKDGSIYLVYDVVSSVPEGLRSVFFVKYAPDGREVWTKSFVEPDRNELFFPDGLVTLRSIDTDSDDAIYLAGSARGDLDDQTNSGGMDTLIIKYDNKGSKVWTRMFGASSREGFSSISIGSDDAIYVAGSGDGDLEDQNFGGGHYDALLTRYDKDGSRIWSKLSGSNLSDYAASLTVGVDGSIYVVGNSSDHAYVQFGSVRYFMFTPPYEAFITRYKSDGTEVWTKRLRFDGAQATGVPETYLSSVITDANGFIYVAGRVLTREPWTSDAFIAKYNSDGTEVWTKRLELSDGTGTSAESLATDSDGVVYMAGDAFYDARVYGFISKFSQDGTREWVRLLGPTTAPVVDTSVTNIAGSDDGAMFLAGTFYADGTVTGNLDGEPISDPFPRAFLSKWYVNAYATTTPTIAISSDKTTLATGETATITFTLSEPSTDFGESDITVTGGSLSGFTGSGLAYSATFTPIANSTTPAVISVASDKFSDAAGNLNTDGADANNAVTITVNTTQHSNPICFARGTLIYAANQAIPVESLTTGSTVQNKSGGIAQCRWIGYQRRAPEFAAFQDYLPVKISAGALDKNLPLRDLYLSPDHAVLVDGHLIHAKALVNGKTIVQMTEWAGDIEYYHIETEAHEIIYAEGVPCETFIDNVSREQFDNYAEYQALYPDTRMMKELPLPRVKFKRQLPTMIKQRLESRITELDRQHKV